jgi:uncharacterized lipoprotein YmbA
MKRHSQARLVTIILLATLLTACAKVKYPNYYELHLTAGADPPAKAEPLPSIAVREFRSPAYLRQGPIVYRTSPEEIGYYEYHRWAVDPRAAVTNAVVERLRASGRFGTVTVYDGHPGADYLLSGRLDELSELDSAGAVQVQVTVSAQVTEMGSGAAVWSNSASEQAAVDQRNVPAIVTKMSGVTDRAIEKLLRSLVLPVPSK